MKLKQTPQQWKAENQAIKEVIRKEVSKIPIEDKLGTDCDELLLEWVWHACACAKTYDKKTDVYRLKRMKDTEELSQGRRAITNAAKALLKGLKMNPKLASGSSVRAFFSLRDQGITFLARKDGTAMPPEELLSTALTELIEGVKHPALSLRNGNFLHETCHGCLGYPDPIRSSRLPDADFMLLFAVVLYIRLRSLGGRYLQEGEPMPKDKKAKPNFGAVAEIVKTIFPTTSAENYSAAQTLLQKRMKRTPDLVLMSWPHDV